MKNVILGGLVCFLTLPGCAAYPYRVLSGDMEPPGLAHQARGEHVYLIRYTSEGQADEERMMLAIRKHADKLCEGHYKITESTLEEAASLCEDETIYILEAKAVCMN